MMNQDEAIYVEYGSNAKESKEKILSFAKSLKSTSLPLMTPAGNLIDCVSRAYASSWARVAWKEGRTTYVYDSNDGWYTLSSVVPGITQPYDGYVTTMANDGGTVDDDVEIIYNGAKISGTSESATVTLETEKMVSEHDVKIKYTKPSGGSCLANLKGLTVTAGNRDWISEIYVSTGDVVAQNDNGIFIVPTRSFRSLEDAHNYADWTNYIPVFCNIDGLAEGMLPMEDVPGYAIGIYIEFNSDSPRVYCNNEMVALNYNSNTAMYWCQILFAEANLQDLPDINIRIQDGE